MRRRDLIIVGGGIGGSALAMVMARAGFDVLVLEKTTAFTDEIRGEPLWPWGVREAQSIGAFDVLIEAGAHVVPWLRTYTDITPGEEHAVDLMASQVPSTSATRLLARLYSMPRSAPGPKSFAAYAT